MQNVLSLLKIKRGKLSLSHIASYLFAFLLFVTAVATVTHPYWANPQFPYTHDGENHLARFANYKIALKEGQFPPRIGPNLHNRYGYPVFNFNYPLANILSVPFSALKVSYETAFSTQVILAVSLAWIGVWLATKSHLKKQVVFPAVLASLYISAPYITTALFYRGNIGEVWAYSLFPWLYLSCIWLSNYSNFKSRFARLLVPVLILIIWISFLLAHNLAVVISLPLLIVFAITTFKNSLEVYVRATILGLLAVGSTLWFWLPALIEKQYITLADVNLSKQFSTHFLHHDDLFIQAHRFGFSLNGFINSSTPSVGFPFLILFCILIGIAVYQIGMFFYKKHITAQESKNENLQLRSNSVVSINTTLLFFGLATFTLLMATNTSSALWEMSSQLMIIQFPWRWLLITPIILVIGVSNAISSVTNASEESAVNTSRVLLILLLPILFIQLIGISRYSPADTFSKNIEDYDAFSMTTSTQNENMPKTFSYKEIADWQPTPTILTNDDDNSYTLNVHMWNGTRRSYSIENINPVLVAEPTMYFPGWKTEITSQSNTVQINLKESIQTYETELQGRIGFMLEPGSHTITTKFTQDTWPRIMGNSISILSICIIVMYLFYEYWFGNKSKATNSRKQTL